jgi:hypothetical protein
LTDTAFAKDVRLTADTLTVVLRDGRRVSVPIDWYPRLAEATPAERRRWKLIGPGIGIHWPSLDEDISVDALLRGLASNETPSSLKRWRAARQRPTRKRTTSKRRLG